MPNLVRVSNPAPKSARPSVGRPMQSCLRLAHIPLDELPPIRFIGGGSNLSCYWVSPSVLRCDPFAARALRPLLSIQASRAISVYRSFDARPSTPR